MPLLDINNFSDSPIKLLGIGDNIVESLKRLEIFTLRDLLFHKPTSYQLKLLEPNLSLLQNGQLIQTSIEIKDLLIPSRRTKPIKILVSNDTGFILLVFFNRPGTFILNKLKIGSKYIIKGKVQVSPNNLPQINHPEFIFNNSSSNQVEPIYPLTYGIINSQLYSYIKKAITLLEQAYGNIPEATQDLRNYIKDLLDDLKILHFYHTDFHNIEEIRSLTLRRFAERELLANQLALKQIRSTIQEKPGNSFHKSEQVQKSILKNLGFELTDDQKKVISEIEQDQLLNHEMMRLLQGDVGSGKTIVALMTMVNVIPHGFQTAIMAPTDLLANQHYQFFLKALKGINIKLELLTGKLPLKERKKILLDLQNGNIDILIGTHALFQETVIFKNLGYIVIDEQHKFGVQQRLDLINKASSPDVLVMTATPIPRSLTLTMFGDMAVSKLISKPKNRLPITTSVIPIQKLNELVTVLDKKLQAKEKIYWICPLIDQNEENSNIEFIDVTTRLASIENIYPNITSSIHGKMKNDQKDFIMQKFKDEDIHILVATTIIEVGIDVPEATLIIIENAEQFGLAQLHQLRGRVGRGNLQSHCILLYNPKRLSQVAKSRFEVMRNSSDGFYIAEQDLLLRGSGEILGTKQSGEIRFFFADLARDTDLLINANQLAENANISTTSHLQIKLFAKAGVKELN
ncbi:MAG: ATP-dependent DNA helicase RecG [Rickettsia endosymbiont of Bryobia graminum]|nr:ATP-dependent DNA helicase RecG [Rickettsia endosymbiont of Bryobia graminum]